jgi:hypothetical protein
MLPDWMFGVITYHSPPDGAYQHSQSRTPAPRDILLKSLEETHNISH